MSNNINQSNEEKIDQKILEEDNIYDTKHEYDNIRELDFPLPRWWLITFYGAIIFSFIYFVYYQVFKKDSILQDYNRQLTSLKEVKSKYLESISNINEEKMNSYINSKEMTDVGEKVYISYCLGCHGEGGKGNIGPNLTDNSFIYNDGSYAAIYPFLITGSPAAGMPAWGETLTEDDLYAVTAYLMKIKNTNHPEGKAAQGSVY
jgi:cytochrome c oxidase cbb3-type subunit 3